MNWKCKCGAWVAGDVEYHTHVVSFEMLPTTVEEREVRLIKGTVTTETMLRKDATEWLR
jgi:hypothetical protein